MNRFANNMYIIMYLSEFDYVESSTNIAYRPELNILYLKFCF